MKTKLRKSALESAIESWYALCRDAARQKIIVVSLSIICALFYLVSAVSFGSNSAATSELQSASRYEIKAGFRAVAMQSAGPLPEMRSGDYVDVIIDSAIVLQRVLVIDFVEQPNRQTTVVLAVPVSNAAMIANAASLGIVSLVLVG